MNGKNYLWNQKTFCSTLLYELSWSTYILPQWSQRLHEIALQVLNTAISQDFFSWIVLVRMKVLKSTSWNYLVISKMRFLINFSAIIFYRQSFGLFKMKIDFDLSNFELLWFLRHSIRKHVWYLSWKGVSQPRTERCHAVQRLDA